jgi:hypothetical protein
VEKFVGFFLVFGWGIEGVEALKGFLFSFSPRSATVGCQIGSHIQLSKPN